MQATLVSFKDIAPAVRHFEFESAEALAFQPGQFVSLTATLAGKEFTRAYSIASQPDGNRFALCLNRVDDGHFSQYMFTLRPGDTITMPPPLGTFTMREPKRDSLLIATGTGIAPFRSILLANLQKGTPAFTLLFGVRHHSGLLYEEEFKELARRHPQFKFLPTLTQPDEHWTGRVGRVQTHLEEATVGRRDIDVYLCGLRPMVDEVRQKLKEMGFDRKQIRYEKYD